MNTNLTVTDAAAEHLRQLLNEKSATEDQGLRLRVERGGCAGMQYTMKIDAPSDNDHIVTKGDVRVFVDTESLPFLEDSQVDYTDALNDAGFKITNPNAARSCGCGTSFEPKEEGKDPSYDPSLDGSVCGSEEEDNKEDGSA